MSRRRCLLLAICLSSLVRAQTDSVNVERYLCHLPAIGSHRLVFEATGLYDASSIRNELVMGLYKGQHLDRDLRERSAEALNGNNRFGYELSARVTYSWGTLFAGNVNMRPRISVAHNDMMGLRFSDDAYNLTFFGNQAYEDRTAELGPSRMMQVRYQTIGFGVEDKRTRSFLELALVSGMSLDAFDLERADLFTGTDGRYLRLDLDGGYARSDTTPASFGESHGLGAALSFDVRRPLNVCHKQAVFAFGMRDLGFIAWNSSSLRVPKDSTVVYEGLRVDDILDLDGAIGAQRDLQDTLGLNYERGAFLRPLPVQLRVGLNLALDSISNLELRVEQRALPGYRPRTVLTYERTIDPRWLRASASLSHGGFGGLRAGLGARASLTRRMTLSLELPNVIGLVSGSARGKAAAIGLDLCW